MHDDHDHGHATHKMNCPAEKCDHVVEAHTHDDDEAVHHITQAAKEHFSEAHPDAKPMSEEEMEKMTKEHMRRHEH